MLVCKVGILVFLLMLRSAIAADAGPSSSSSPKEKSKKATVEATKKEMEKAEKHHADYLKNTEEAKTSGIAMWHSEYDNWLEKNSQRNKVESNSKRHALTSKILQKEQNKEYGIVSDILHGRSEEIKRKSDGIQHEMDHMKKRVKYDQQRYLTRLSEHSKKLKGHERSMAKYREKIHKISQE